VNTLRGGVSLADIRPLLSATAAGRAGSAPRSEGDRIARSREAEEAKARGERVVEVRVERSSEYFPFSICVVFPPP
jgi:hypothetical protein